LSAQPGKARLGRTWWFLVTIGAAHFGLGEFALAEPWLSRAAALEDVTDWELESTARELADLLRLMQRQAAQGGTALDPQAEVVLAKLLGGARAAVASVVRGKIGL